MNVFAGTTPAKNTFHHGVDGLASCGYQCTVADLEFFASPTNPAYNSSSVFVGVSPEKNTFHHGVEGLTSCGYQYAVVDLEFLHLPPTHPTIFLPFPLVSQQYKMHFITA